MAGRWFENFRIEQVFEREIRRTVTASDNVTFTTATMNSAAIHIDAEYCKTTEFGRPLVNSIFTLGLGIGLSVQDTTLGTTVAKLGISQTRFRLAGIMLPKANSTAACRPGPSAWSLSPLKQPPRCSTCRATQQSSTLPMHQHQKNWRTCNAPSRLSQPTRKLGRPASTA